MKPHCTKKTVFAATYNEAEYIDYDGAYPCGAQQIDGKALERLDCDVMNRL